MISSLYTGSANLPYNQSFCAARLQKLLSVNPKFHLSLPLPPSPLISSATLINLDYNYIDPIDRLPFSMIPLLNRTPKTSAALGIQSSNALLRNSNMFRKISQFDLLEHVKLAIDDDAESTATAKDLPLKLSSENRTRKVISTLF